MFQPRPVVDQPMVSQYLLITVDHSHARDSQHEQETLDPGMQTIPRLY